MENSSSQSDQIGDVPSTPPTTGDGEIPTETDPNREMRGEDDLVALQGIFPDHNEALLRAALELSGKTSSSNPLTSAVDFVMDQSKDSDSSPVSGKNKRRARFSEKGEPTQVKKAAPSPSSPDHTISSEDDGMRAPGAKGSIESSVESLEEKDYDVLADQNIFEAVEQVVSRFPGVDPNWVYQKLEGSVHLHKKKSKLVEELEIKEGDKSRAQAELPGPSGTQKTPTIAGFLSSEETNAFEQVMQMFPMVDPHYVVERIAQSGESLESMVNRMTNDSSYPKWKDRVEKERKDRRRTELLDPLSFDIDEFLTIFPDPEAYFTQETREVSENYKEHARISLSHRFVGFSREEIMRVLEANHSHYLPAYKELCTRAKTRKNVKRNGRNEEPEWPNDVNEGFFRELQYVANEQDIKDQISMRQDQRRQKLDQSRADGNLRECSCCLSEDILPEEMVSCSDSSTDHQFCINCVKEHCKVQLGEGHHQIKCMSPDCKKTYEITVLRKIVDGKSLGTLLKRSQENELRNAKMENMEECPFCDFAMIIENPDERLFRCQNLDCLRESCRQCKEMNHIPLKCSEVEKASETRMRTFVEDKMAEAMIRKCSVCGKRIIKSDGCNKMQCPCGAYMCYVCGETLTTNNPYDHFEKTSPFRPHSSSEVSQSKTRHKCRLYTNMDEVHADVAAKAGEDAKKRFIELHPNFKDAASSVRLEELVDRNPGTHFFLSETHQLGTAMRGFMNMFRHQAAPGRGRRPRRNPARLDIHLEHFQPPPEAIQRQPRPHRDFRVPRIQCPARTRHHQENPNEPNMTPWWWRPPGPMGDHFIEELSNFIGRGDDEELASGSTAHPIEVATPTAPEAKFNGPEILQKMRRNMQILFRHLREELVREKSSEHEINSLYMDMKVLTPRLLANDETCQVIAEDLLNRIQAQIRMEQYRVNAREMSATNERSEGSSHKSSNGKKIKPIEDSEHSDAENADAVEKKETDTKKTSEAIVEDHKIRNSASDFFSILRNPETRNTTKEKEKKGEESRNLEKTYTQNKNSERNHVSLSAKPAAKLSELKRSRDVMQEKLNSSILRVTRCKDPQIQRNEFRTMQSFMKERDRIVRQIQETEADALRKGVPEEELRPEVSQLHLEPDEINGAAEEAKELSNKSKAERKKEAESMMSSKKELHRLDKALAEGTRRRTNTIIRGPGIYSPSTFHENLASGGDKIHRETHEARQRIHQHHQRHHQRILERTQRLREVEEGYNRRQAEVMREDQERQEREFQSNFFRRSNPFIKVYHRMDNSQPQCEQVDQRREWRTACSPSEQVERRNPWFLGNEQGNEKTSNTAESTPPAFTKVTIRGLCSENVTASPDSTFMANETRKVPDSNQTQRNICPPVSRQTLDTINPTKRLPRDSTTNSMGYHNDEVSLAEHSLEEKSANNKGESAPVCPSDEDSNAVSSSITTNPIKQTNKRKYAEKKIDNLNQKSKPHHILRQNSQVELKAASETERLLRARVEGLQRSLQLNHLPQMMQEMDRSRQRIRALEQLQAQLRQALANVTQSIDNASIESVQLGEQVNQTVRMRREEENTLAQAREDLRVISERVNFLKRESRVEEESDGPSSQDSNSNGIPKDLVQKMKDACASGKEKKIRRLLDKAIKESAEMRPKSPCLISLVSDDEDQLTDAALPKNMGAPRSQEYPAESTAEIFIEPMEPLDVSTVDDVFNYAKRHTELQQSFPPEEPHTDSKAQNEQVLKPAVSSVNVGQHDPMEVSPPQLQRSFSLPAPRALSHRPDTNTSAVNLEWAKYYRAVGLQKHAEMLGYRKPLRHPSESGALPPRQESPGFLTHNIEGPTTRPMVPQTETQRGVIQINIHLPDGGANRNQRCHQLTTAHPGADTQDSEKKGVPGEGPEEEHMDFEETS